MFCLRAGLLLGVLEPGALDPFLDFLRLSFWCEQLRNSAAVFSLVTYLSWILKKRHLKKEIKASSSFSHHDFTRHGSKTTAHLEVLGCLLLSISIIQFHLEVNMNRLFLQVFIWESLNQKQLVLIGWNQGMVSNSSSFVGKFIRGMTWFSTGECHSWRKSTRLAETLPAKQPLPRFLPASQPPSRASLRPCANQRRSVKKNTSGAQTKIIPRSVA